MIKRIPYLVLGLVCCVTLAFGQQPPTFIVSPQNLTVDPDDNVSFNVTVNDFADFVSFQYSMNWDPDILEYVSVSDFNSDAFPGISESSIGATNAISNGEISVSWLENSLNPTTVPDGSAVYTINFVAIGSGTTSVAITETPSVFEVINSNDQDVGLNHEDATVTVTGDVIGGNTDPLGLSVNSASGENGTNICVPIRVSNFDNVNSFQFSINYDSDVLNYSSLQNFGVTGLDISDFTVPPSSAEGQISVDWSNPSGVSVTDNSTLVEVCFDIVGTAPESSTISFTGTPTAINVTTVASNGSDVGITPTTGTITVESDGGGNGGALVISAGNASGDSGTEVCVPVTVRNFNEIISFQFSMNYDPSVLNFSGVQNFNLVDFDASGFNTPPQSAEGQISVNWFDNSTNGITLPNNTVLFEICFDIVGAGQTSSTIGFTGTPTPIEVTTLDSDGVDVGLSPSSGTISVTGEGGGNGGNGELILSAGSATGNVGTDVCIPVRVRDFDNIVSFQHSINYNPAILSFNGVQNINLIDLAEGSFGNANPGQITVSWIDDTTNGVTLPDNTVIYELCFSLINGGTSTISFSGNPSPIEVTTVESDGQDVGLVGNSGQIVSEGSVVFDGLTFIAENESVEPGDDFCIDVTVHDFIDIISFQYSMTWDESVIEFTGVQGFDLPDLDEGNFGTSGVENGVLSVSWLDDTTEGVTKANGDAIFQVCFTVVGEFGESTGFTFGSTPTAIEVIDNQEMEIIPDFSNGVVTIETPNQVPDVNFTITPPAEAVAIGNTFCMPLAVSNFNNITDMQFTINYPAELLQFTEAQITGNLAGLGTAQINSNTSGQITVSWTAPSGSESLANGTAILNLCFTVLQAGPNNAATITFSNGSINNENGDAIDVNGSQVTVPLGNPPVIFPIGAATVCTDDIGGQICVPISTYNFDDLISMQYTIEFDETLLEFESVNILAAGDSQMGLSPSSFNTDQSNTDQGFIPFSWLENNLNCITITDDTPIYELCFTVIGNAGQSSPISFTESSATYEVINCDEQEVPWEGRNGAVNIMSSCDGCIINIEETVTDITCNGLNDGSISLVETGCTGTPVYSWSSGQGNTPNISGLPAGNYTVTVTVNGQQAIETYQVNQPDAIVISNVNPTDVSCFGGMDGMIDLGITGGTGGYTYSFSPGGANTNPATGLSPGTYSVTVMDANDCIETVDNIVIDQPAAALAISSSVTDVVCGGDATGEIDLTVTGGTADYTYNWDNVGVFGSNPTGLLAGTYQVTVTDENGCEIAESITVGTINPVISISNVVVTPITGDGNNGAINVDVGGGSGGGFTYLWEGPDFTAATQDISGLNNSGMYLLTVTDQTTGCMAFASVNLPSPLTVNEGEAVITPTCFGQTTGGVDISPMGGMPEYTFSWSNDTSNEDLTGVGAGTYTVTITDGANTMVTATFTVGTTDEVTVLGDILPDTGIGNGSIDLNVSGGVGPFNYSWSPDGETNEDLFDKDAGTYTVTITDTGSGCVEVIEYVIPLVEEPLGATVTAQGVSCNGIEDGEVTVNIAGGSPQYAITFDPAIDGQPIFNNGAEQTITGFAGGSYMINITDATGAMFTQMVTIPEPDAIALDAATQIFDAINTVNCDGAIDLEVMGGIEPYTYAWTSSTGAVIPGVENPGQLCPGLYTPTVTDANGCTQVLDALVVKQFMIEDSETNLIDPDCPGIETGGIEVTVINGSEPRTYSWTNNAGEEVGTEEDLSGVSAGTYTLVVTDNDGRSITQQFTLTAISNISATATVETNYNGFGVRCADSDDARLSVTPNSGTSPYTYLWSNGETSAIILNASAGLQTVIVTDNAGCETEASVMVTAPPAISIDLDVEDISCNNEDDGEIIAFASGGVGGFNYRWDDGPNGSSRFNLEEGTYNIEVTDINGCRVDSTRIITNPDELTIEAIATPITDTETGSATVIVAGGTEPYTYIWNDANNTETQTLENISKEGPYVVIVSDDHGCVKVAEVEVTLLANCLKSRPVITPGDGELNEEFIINCVENYPGNTLEVYNRWGQLVYEADDYDNTWTGTNRRGNPLPEGGYFYVLTYKDVSGQLTQLKGSLSILRQ